MVGVWSWKAYLFEKEQASKLILNFIFELLLTEGHASHFVHEVHEALLLNSWCESQIFSFMEFIWSDNKILNVTILLFIVKFTHTTPDLVISTPRVRSDLFRRDTKKVSTAIFI